jgi:hypothetical protein
MDAGRDVGRAAQRHRSAQPLCLRAW